MIVAGETVTLVVTAEAVDVLKTLSVNVLDPPTVVVFVEVTDDLGTLDSSEARRWKSSSADSMGLHTSGGR